MEPRIELLLAKKLIGKRLNMSIANNRTFELWHNFIPLKKNITTSLTTDLFCLQVYDDALDFKEFTQSTEFDKWAAVEVSDFSNMPDGMEAFTLNGGLYAVFNYVGTASEFHIMFEFIFNNWLPNSSYELDKRPHFEILGEKYRNNDPSSEEEIWIPIKPKE